MSDLKVLEKEYPCLAAVNRCANSRIFCFYLSLLLRPTQIFLPLLNVDFKFTFIVSSSYRCTSPSGQSYQAAVLWRGTSPEDAHVGGKGERRLLFIYCIFDCSLNKQDI